MENSDIFPRILLNLSYTYKNNRVQGAGWQYDMDGRNLQTAYPDDYASSVYNAAGQMIRSKTEQTDALRWYDGSGREIKRRTANFHETQTSLDWIIQPIKYYIRSSVLGNEVVSEVWANGKKGKTFVRAAGAQLAVQSAYGSDTANLNEAVFFEYTDASGMSQRTTDKTGAAVSTGDGGDGSPVETDPLGGNVGTYTPYIELSSSGWDPQPEYPMLLPFFDDAPQYVNGQRVSCTLDGVAIGCSSVQMMMDVGAAAQCPNNDCGPQVFQVRQPDGSVKNVLSSPFQAYADGTSGYQIPVWGRTTVENLDGTIFSQGKETIVDWIFKSSGGQVKPLGLLDPAAAILWAASLWDSDVYKEATIDAAIYDSGNGYYIEREGREKLKQFLRQLITPECGQAFRKYGMERPFDTLREGKTIFAARELLNDSNYNSIFGYSEEIRAKASTSTAVATSIPNRFTETGRGVTFLAKNFDKDLYTGADSIAHEIMHSGNDKLIERTWLQYFNGQHDLSNLPGYEEIMRACSMRGRQ